MVENASIVGEFISFAEKLEDFLKSLDLENKQVEKRLTREVIKYVLKITDCKKKHTYVLKKAFSSLGYKAQIDRFQTEYLNISYYIFRVLFPAMVAKVRNTPLTLGPIVDKDIAFCLHYLTGDEINSFKTKTVDYDTTIYPDFNTAVKNSWVRNYKGLYGYVRSKASKLSILISNDPSLDMEDCIQDILLSIVRVYNVDPKAFKNQTYVDVAISNAVNAILNYYTRGKRKRVRSTQDVKYNRIKAIKKQMFSPDVNKAACAGKILEIKQTIKSGNDDYYATFVDVKHAKKALSALSVDSGIDDAILVNELLEKASSKQFTKEYFQILLGHNAEFETWAEQNSLKTSCFTSMCKSAKRYLRHKYDKQIPITTWPFYIEANMQLRQIL